MASKTPYEIRLNLLELSHRILTNQKAAESVAEWKTTASSSEVFYVDKAPSTTEIIEEAEKLNNFVSTSKERPK